MLSAQPLPVTSTEINELTLLPSNGLVPGTTAAALRLPSPPVTYSSSVMQPMVQFESQLLGILSDIDTTPSPFASPATAAQQSVRASPLTERAFRYHRRDALRTDRSTVAPVPLPSPTDSPDPLDDFGAETHKQDRLNFTPAPPSESLHSTIQSKIPSLGPEQYRPISAHSQPRMPFEYSTPATFPRLIQAPHTADQRPLSAGPCCPPRAPPLPARSRASRGMSSPPISSPAKAAAKGIRPFVLGTASSRLDAKPGRPQGVPSPVASSALRAISGSGSDRTHGPRPDAPVSPRALLGGPRGPPAHFGCLDQVWDSMDPTLRTRIGSIIVQDVEASVARARAATDDDQARTTPDACVLSLADKEYPRHGTTADKSGCHRLRTRRSLGSHPPPREPTALYGRGDGNGRTPTPADRLQHWGRLSTATSCPRRDALSGPGCLRHFLRPHCSAVAPYRSLCPSSASEPGCTYGFHRPFSRPGGWEHYAPTAATDRPRAVHHRRPVVNCLCAPPTAAPTNSPR